MVPWLLVLGQALGASAWLRQDRRAGVSRPRFQPRWLELAFLLTLALAFTLLNIRDLTAPYYAIVGDEYAFWELARHILHGAEGLNIFSQRGVYDDHPVMDSVYHAASMWLFGETMFGWKMTSIVMILAAIFLVYSLARSLFGTLAAAAAALTLASSHYLFAYVHNGYNNLFAIPFTVAGIWLAVLALQHQSALIAFGAGVVAGLSFYTFAPARVTILIILGYLILSHSRSVWRWFLPPLLFGFGAVVLPILASDREYVFTHALKHSVTQTEATSNQSGIVLLVTNLYRSALAFNFNEKSAHYTAGSLLDPMTAVLAGLGLACLVAALRYRPARLLLLWHGAAIFMAGGLSKYPWVTETRLHFVLPVLAVCVGLAVKVGAARAGEFLQPRWRLVFGLGLALLVPLAFALNIYRFWHVTPSIAPVTAETLALEVALAPACDQPGRPPPLIIAGRPTPVLEPAIEAYRLGARAPIVAQPDAPWQLTGFSGTPCVIIIEPNTPTVLAIMPDLQQRFPELQPRPYSGPAGLWHVLVMSQESLATPDGRHLFHVMEDQQRLAWWLFLAPVVAATGIFGIIARRDLATLPRWSAAGDTPTNSTLEAAEQEAREGQVDWPVAARLIAGVGLVLAAQLLLVPAGALLLAAPLFISGGLLCLTALAGRPFPGPTVLPMRIEMIAVGLILGLAVVFRFCRLAVHPEGVWHDEAEIGLAVRRILTEPAFRPSFLLNLPAMHLYVQALVTAVMGEGIVPLRIGTAVFGVVTVAGTYLLARQMFGVPVAVVAAMLLAVERWHATLSRTAMNGALAPAFAVGALYFAMRGLRLGGWRDFTIAGVLLGLGLHTYTPFLITPLLLGVTTLAMTLASGAPRRFLTRHWRGLVIMGIIAGTLSLPLVRFAVLYPDIFFSRPQATSLLSEGKPLAETATNLLENTRRHLLMFHITGDANGRHTLPHQPMLDPFTATLLVPGLFLSLRAARRPEHILLLTWLALGLAPGIISLSFEAPQGLRSIMVTPVVAILAALAPGWLISRALEARRGSMALLVGLPAVVVLALAIWSNYQGYFVQQRNHYDAWASFSTAETMLARQINRLPLDTQIFVSPTLEGHPTVRFLSPRAGANPTFDPARHLPLRGDGPAVIFVNPMLDTTLDQILRLYPKASVTNQRGPGGPSILTMVVINSEETRALQSVRASYYASADLADPPLLTRTEAGLGVALAEPPPGARVVVWDGTLATSVSGNHQFWLEGPLDATLTIDDRVIARGGQAASLTLAQGMRPFQIVAPFDGAAFPRLLWRPPGASDWEPMPGTALFAPLPAYPGLLGAYYPNGDWAGEPAFLRLDHTLNFRFHARPLSSPWSAEWRGRITIPSAGVYQFATASTDGSWLFIDDQLVVDNSAGKGQVAEGAIALTSGEHAIRVRYVDATDYTFLRVYWTPPGAESVIIPAEFLAPP